MSAELPAWIAWLSLRARNVVLDNMPDVLVVTAKWMASRWPGCGPIIAAEICAARPAPPPLITWGNTERGFGRGEFKDRYSLACSIQRSSIAFEDCIWLGSDEPTFMLNSMPSPPPPGYKVLARMHLNRAMAAELWPLLKAFAETGSLNGDGSEEA